MSSKLLDNRVQFYLNHRDTIREWAAIEEDVRRAVLGLLDGLQAPLEREVRERDPQAVVTRWDGSGYRRIVIRHAAWPSGLCIAIEWVRTKVDPFGGDLPKIGVFFVAKGEADKALRRELVEALKAAGGFAGMGYKVSQDSVWPALKYLPKSSDWWKDPEAWTAAVAAEVVAIWDKAAPVIVATIGT
jgi:hypothetical protein